MKSYFKIFAIYLVCGFFIPVLLCIPSLSFEGLLLNHHLLSEWLFPLFKSQTMSYELAEMFAFIIRLLFTASFAFIGIKKFKTGLICEVFTSLINVGALILTVMKYG